MIDWLAMMVASARQQHHGDQEPPGAEPEEDVAIGGRPVQHDGGLAGIVEDEAREHDAEPGQADRRRAEMPHVGVERFGSRDAQEHAAEHQERREAARSNEAKAVERVHGDEHGWIVPDAGQPENRERQEPETHHGTEGLADALGPERLDGEQADEDHDGRGQHVRLERGCDHVQAFQRGQHRDRRGHCAVAVDERGSEQAQRDDQGAVLLDPD